MYCLGRLLNKLACLNTNDFLAWQIDIDLIINHATYCPVGKDGAPITWGVFIHVAHSFIIVGWQISVGGHSCKI